MKKHQLGKTQSFTILVTTALALFNIGIFGILLLGGNQISGWIKQNFEVQIFLHRDVSPENAQKFGQWLGNQSFIAKEHPRAIRFVSKEEAGQNFRKETGEDFAEFLGENPLRDAYSIKISEENLNNSSLRQIKAALAKNTEVFEVVYVENLAGNIQENLARLSMILISISLILLFTVVWLIRNTIKLSVFSSRFLIRTMELVGAKPGFIQAPFIKNMIIQGFLAGVLAAIFLQIFILLLGRYYQPIGSMVPQTHIWALYGLLLIFGMALNAICAYLSIRKYLGRTLDFMYQV